MDNNYCFTGTEKQRQCVMNSIAKTFYQGELPYIFYALIDKCLNEYGFDPQVVYQLFSMCYDKAMHRKLSYVEQLASNWYKHGYRKPEDLNEFILLSKKTKQICNFCMQILRRRFNDLDVERIEKWITEYNASEPLVRYAFQTNDFRSYITLQNIENTLAKWHANGVKTVEDAVSFCEKEHQENIRKRKLEMQSKENQFCIFAVQPLWHFCSEETPIRNGPYLVTQRETVNDGESITVEKRWFRNGEWPLTQYEKDTGVKLEVLSWAILPSPCIPQTDNEE